MKIKFLAPADTYYPRVRNDTKEILRLVYYLNNTLKASDKVYILSSSEIFNSGTVTNACVSLGCNIFLTPKILATHDVDKRDGFPQGIVYAAYIIVANPVQIHLRPEGQRLVTELAEAMFAQKNIGKHFIKLPDSFTLTNNTKVYIFKKISAIDKESLQELSDIIKSYYPDKEYIYKVEEL